VAAQRVRALLRYHHRRLWLVLGPRRPAPRPSPAAKVLLVAVVVVCGVVVILPSVDVGVTVAAVGRSGVVSVVAVF